MAMGALGYQDLNHAWLLLHWFFNDLRGDSMLLRLTWGSDFPVQRTLPKGITETGIEM